MACNCVVGRQSTEDIYSGFYSKHRLLCSRPLLSYFLKCIVRCRSITDGNISSAFSLRGNSAVVCHNGQRHVSHDCQSSHAYIYYIELDIFGAARYRNTGRSFRLQKLKIQTMGFRNMKYEKIENEHWLLIKTTISGIFGFLFEMYERKRKGRHVHGSFLGLWANTVGSIGKCRQLNIPI